MAMLSITKPGADGFGLTGGITKVIKLDDSDSENNKNQMLILPKRKVITQADWNELEKKAAAAQNDELEITEERATMMTDDGKIIIDEKI